MRRICTLVAIALLTSGMFGSLALAQGKSFEVRDLIEAHASPEFEVQGVGAFSITDDGEIVGFTAADATKSSPFHTVDGKPERVKTGEWGATFSDINSSGVITGREITGRLSSGAPTGNPAIWVDGQITLLEIPASPTGTAFVSGAARGINEDGFIAGDVQFVHPDYPDEVVQYVVVWQDGVPSILADAFGYPYCGAADITESGVIGGQCWDPNASMFSPIVWSDFTPQTVEIIDLLNKYTMAIVDYEDGYAMVGYMEGTPDLPSYTPFLIIDGAYTPLFPPEGLNSCTAWTVAETSDGLVVGGQCMPTPEDFINLTDNRQAVVWSSGTAYPVAELVPDADDWHFIYVRDINSAGQMVGLGERDGERRSFVLTPS